MLTQEEEQFLQDVQREIEQKKLENAQLQKNYGQVSSMFSGETSENLIQWQLDLSEEKEKIDHLLRGHVIKTDENHNEYWAEPDNPRSKSLTDYGVEQLMNVVNFYLSRNLILSNYDEDTINWKMKDAADEIADKIFMEYEYVFYQPTIKELLRRDKDKIEEIKERYKGNEKLIDEVIEQLYKDYLEEMEQIYKKNIKQFPMIVRLLVDTIHAAHLRALNGGERDSLRTARHVSQSEGYGTGRPGQMAPQKKFSMFRPTTWGK